MVGSRVKASNHLIDPTFHSYVSSALRLKLEHRVCSSRSTGLWKGFIPISPGVVLFLLPTARLFPGVLKNLWTLFFSLFCLFLQSNFRAKSLGPSSHSQVWSLHSLTLPLVWLIILLNLKFTLFDLTYGCHAALLNVSHANAVGHFPLRRTITLHKGNQRHC